MHIVLVSVSSGHQPFPLGLAYLASNLRTEYEDTVEIVDVHALGLTTHQACEKILEAKPSVVGLSYVTYQAKQCYELSRMLKQAKRDITIVHGGIHASVLPIEACANGADCVVIGEGEETFQELIDHLRTGERLDGVAGLCFKKPDSQEVTTNLPRPLINDLDKLAPPRWDAFNLNLYLERYLKPNRVLPIMGSRGCAFDCSFCASLMKRKVRYRTPDNVVAELTNNISHHGVSKFLFWDDSFLTNTKFAKALCELMIEKQLNIEWSCLSRVDHINRNTDMLDLMREAGCRNIGIGVESLDQSVLDMVNKRQTIGDSFKALKHLRRSGIHPSVLLMTCNVGETIAGHYHQNRRLVKMTGTYCVFWSQFATPFPGSRFFDDAKKEGLVLADSWSSYMTDRMTFVPNSLLNDVPVRNRRFLWPVDRFLCYVALRGRTSRFEDASLDTHVTCAKVYGLIDGKRTVQDIADALVGLNSVSSKVILKDVVKVVITLAQLGLISSAKPGGQTKPYGVVWLVRWVINATNYFVGRVRGSLRGRTLFGKSKSA